MFYVKATVRGFVVSCAGIGLYVTAENIARLVG